MKLRVTSVTSVVAILSFAGIVFSPYLFEMVWPYILAILTISLVMTRRSFRETLWYVVENTFGEKGWNK